MISFWEKIAFTKYDLVVIGSGFTGLFCALSFKKKNPKSKIVILERGIFPNGASTKNAGFACFGSISELIEDSQKMSDDEILELVEKRVLGLELLKKTIPKKYLEIKNWGGYELFFDEKINLDESIDRFNKLLKPIFKSDVYSINNEKIELFGFPKNKVKQLVYNPFESQINTGTTVYKLQEIANQNGIKILNGCNVESFTFNSKHHEILVSSKGGNIKFRSNFLAICSNAFSIKWFPNEKIIPGRGMVLVTKPIKNLKLKGCFHYNKGYYYFRNYKRRIIFGGGREADFKAEQTTSFGLNRKIKSILIKDLKKIIIPNYQFEIDMEWSGIMAFGPTKQPIIKNLGNNSVIGARLGGMGIALSSLVGKNVSDLFDN